MPPRPPELPGVHSTETPLDRALTLLLAGETESALRWAAAVVERDPSPSALILTSRLLAMLGRAEASQEGLRLGLSRAIDGGHLPLAVAAVGDLRSLGVDVLGDLARIADAFHAGSSRLSDAENPPPPLPHAEGFEPLSSFLTGPALLSKATQIVRAAKSTFEEVDDALESLVPKLPLFGSLGKEALVALLDAFSMITVSAGEVVIEEGEEGAEAFIVARGELEVRRAPPSEGEASILLARLTTGALFGEMALLSRAPRAASVVAQRPSILLVAKRDELEAVADAHPEVGTELAAHCRRRMVENLVRTSPVLRAVEPKERVDLVERFETRVFGKGERLITGGSESQGLHLIASGEVAVVGREGGEPLVLTTLAAGEMVGEVALVLRRKSSADVVAVHPSVTLFLPRSEFMSLVEDHPAVLHSLYMSAVQRDDETTRVLSAAPTSIVADDYVLV